MITSIEHDNPTSNLSYVQTATATPAAHYKHVAIDPKYHRCAAMSGVFGWLFPSVESMPSTLTISFLVTGTRVPDVIQYSGLEWL